MEGETQGRSGGVVVGAETHLHPGDGEGGGEGEGGGARLERGGGVSDGISCVSAIHPPLVHDTHR